MTLFKFNAFDLDDEDTDENKLDFELIHAKLGNSSILDWFDLFTSNHSGGIKLTDLGYERLTKPSSNPQETIELIVETSDGLFSNRLSYHLNVNRLDSSSRRTSRSYRRNAARTGRWCRTPRSRPDAARRERLHRSDLRNHCPE